MAGSGTVVGPSTMKFMLYATALLSDLANVPLPSVMPYTPSPLLKLGAVKI